MASNTRAWVTHVDHRLQRAWRTGVDGKALLEDQWAERHTPAILVRETGTYGV